MHSWKKLTFYLILAVAVTTNAAELVDGPFSKLQAKYKSLSPKGKVATGAAVGFIGSRLALTTVASVAKVGAAAFITAEALKMTGLLDDLPKLSEGHNDMILKAKTAVLRTTEDYRIQIRRSLSQDGIKNLFENERMAALALAGGAVAGAIL